MTDSMSTEERSARMARVRQKDTAPELKVRRFLHAEGFRYRLHARALPGRPDLVFPKHRVALFVHGCYWHGHSCRAGRKPSSNVDYWGPKLLANQERDERKTGELVALGWTVLTVWECELRRADAKTRLGELAAEIRALPDVASR